MAAEDKLAEIYQEFLYAKENKDEAMETLAEALRLLKTAHARYDAAVVAFGQFMGEEVYDEGGDSGDIFTTITGGGLKLTNSSLSKMFGDLF
jgi:hypothetical protein